MKTLYSLEFRSESLPNELPYKITSTSPFGAISVGDTVIGKEAPLAPGARNVVTSIEHEVSVKDTIILHIIHVMTKVVGA